MGGGWGGGGYIAKAGIQTSIFSIPSPSECLHHSATAPTNLGETNWPDPVGVTVNRSQEAASNHSAS